MELPSGEFSICTVLNRLDTFSVHGNNGDLARREGTVSVLSELTGKGRLVMETLWSETVRREVCLSV